MTPGISEIMLIGSRGAATMAYRRRLIRRATICTSITTKVQFAATRVYAAGTRRIDNRASASLGDQTIDCNVFANLLLLCTFKNLVRTYTCIYFLFFFFFAFFIAGVSFHAWYTSTSFILVYYLINNKWCIICIMRETERIYNPSYVHVLYIYKFYTQFYRFIRDFDLIWILYIIRQLFVSWTQ